MTDAWPKSGMEITYIKVLLIFKFCIMAKYSKASQKKVENAMHEMHEGKLKSGGSGKKVTSRKQAIAIGLSEAREAGGKVPKKAASKKSAKKAGKKTAKKSAKKTARKSTKKAAKKSTKKRSSK